MEHVFCFLTIIITKCVFLFCFEIERKKLSECSTKLIEMTEYNNSTNLSVLASEKTINTWIK